MKTIVRVTLMLCIVSAVVSCAGLPGNTDETARIPATGKALVIGVKPGGSVELIIRTVNGKVMGELPFKPAYEVELEPGTYQIGPFCIVKTSYGKQMGPTDELKLQVEAGHVYKLQATPGGKMCSVRAEDVTTAKK
jgi:hypothetical protein